MRWRRASCRSADWWQQLPRYAIHKAKATLLPSGWPPRFAALEQHFADAQTDRLDGLRLDWPNKWLLIRGSNTEPIVRIFAEAPTAAEAQATCAAALAVLEACA